MRYEDRTDTWLTSMQTAVDTMATSQPPTSLLPSNEQGVNNWSVFMINNVIIALTLLGNSTTLYLIARNKSLQSVTNKFVISLACADLLMGCIYPLYNTLNYTTFYTDASELHVPCSISLYFIVVSAGVSNLSLLAVSIDRYIAVVHPFHYHMKVTERRANVTIVAIWVYIVIASSSLFIVYGQDTMTYYVAPCSMLNLIPEWYFFGIILPHMLLPNICSKILYGRIVCVAQRLESKTYGLNVELRGQVHAKREYRAAKVMALIMILFLLCWAPYIIFHVIIHVIGTESPDWLFVALELSKVLSVSSACINPIIYTWKSEGFRRALTSMCGCRSCHATDGQDKELMRKRSLSVTSSVGIAPL